jgi:hypothetical protein
MRFSPIAFEFRERIDGRRRDLQMNEGKKRQTPDVLCFASSWLQALQLWPRGWEMKDYTFCARPFLYFFGDWLHSVSVRSGSCSSRRETKSVVKSVVPTRTVQPTTIQPTKTNQPVKKQKLVGPRVGAKNLPKRRQETFFSRA